MAEKTVILHVDDDEANRYAVTHLLTKAGFEVIEASRGAEALLKVADIPDLVILDVRLPDIGGFEVCKRIKANPATSRIPILHLSASFTTSGDKADGLDGGADAYLVRPVAPVELLANIRALLRARRMEEDLRQSEDRYRQIVENVKDFAIFSTDPQGIIRSWNVGAERLVGYRDEEIIGQPADVIYTLEDRAEGIPAKELAGALRDGCAPDERWHLKRDGSRFFTNGVVTPMHDAAGRLTGFSKLMQDVTQRRLAQQELQKSKEIAEQAQASAELANRLKDDFLATLSHELRTPLNAIVGWTQLLRAPATTPDDFAEGLETIERNAKVQSQLIDDLLDISRIISGKLRLDSQHIDLIEVIKAAVSSVAPSAEAKQVEIETTLESSALTVFGDGARLQQVFWNLLTNAIKFTPRGGRVSVTLQTAAAIATINVIDTGKGIDAAFLPHVFDRFRQADATSKRSQAGLGLGLSIVKQLVELHGGTVSAASAGDNQGARFTVTLPLQPAASATSTKPATLDPAPSRWRRDQILSGVKVLIVEDDSDAREILTRIMGDSGATAVCVASVAEALQRIERASADAKSFDVIVSDIGMPGEDGYDLISRIRQRSIDQGGHIPAIAVTAFARPDDRNRALTAGFQAHITKPANRRRTHLRRRQSH